MIIRKPGIYADRNGDLIEIFIVRDKSTETYPVEGEEYGNGGERYKWTLTGDWFASGSKTSEYDLVKFYSIEKYPEMYI